MHCKKLVSVAIAGVLLLDAGCDKSVDSKNYRLTVYPSLGMMKYAKVRIYAADGRTLLRKGNTGVNGIVGVAVGPVRGPVVIAVQGHRDVVYDYLLGSIEGAWYFDENVGEFVSFPAGSVMRAVVPSAYGEYAVTPLTELAYRIAVDQQLFPLTTGEVNTLNGRVRDALAPELDSIIAPPTIIADKATVTGLDESLPKDRFAWLDALDPEFSPLEDTQANRYALRLAAMAKVGNGALSTMYALNADILDEATGVDINGDMVDDRDGTGIINNYDINGVDLGAPYDPVTLVGDMNTALASFVDTFAVAGFPVAADISLNLDLSNIDDGSNFTGCGPGDSDLPDDVKGVSLNMTFEQGNVVSPYDNEEVLRVSFCSNGQLRLDSDYYVVADSFTATAIDAIETDYTWVQSANNMVYEMVTMDGLLFEVNVYGDNGSIYYGRFVE